jgi:hypothetical protein
MSQMRAGDLLLHPRPRRRLRPAAFGLAGLAAALLALGAGAVGIAARRRSTV